MTLRAVLDRHQRAARRVIQPGNRVTLAWGRGAGKTSFGALLIHDLAFRFPGIHIGLVLPELKQARKVFWEPHLFGHYYGPLRNEITAPPNRTDLSVTYRNGSRLTTWGTENAHGIRGQRFGAVVQDETDKILPSIEQAIVGPCFSRSGKQSIWVRMGTPLRGRQGSLYGSHRLALDGEPRFYTSHVKSSESEWVDQDWLEEQRRVTDPKTFAREYDVDFDAAEGLIYGDVFNESVSVADPPDGIVFNHDGLIVGCDHGYEHPGAMLLIGVAGKGPDATVYVLDEFYRQHKTTAWWARQLSKWTSANHGTRITLYADPSQPQAIETYREQAGVRVPRSKVDNAVDDGIASVASRFMVYDGPSGPRSHLYVSPRCQNLIRELGLYRYKPDPKEADKFQDTPEKRNDDACDALRYAIYNHLGPAPSAVRQLSDGDARR